MLVLRTVMFNFNFIFTRMYMRGTMKLLHCIPITCLRGPRLLIACNMHVSCNLHMWKYTHEYTRGSTCVHLHVQVRVICFDYDYDYDLITGLDR